MFNDLTGLGYSLVVFAIIIGVGTVVLVNFGNASAQCGAYTFDTATQMCLNSTGGDPTTATGSWATTNYLTGQLGQSGLAGWTPAIIAISIGVMFLGAFMIGGKKKGRY